MGGGVLFYTKKHEELGQLLLIMGGGVLFYTKKHEELGQRKKSSFGGCPRTSCVIDMGYWRRAVVFHLLMSVVRGGGVATKRSKSYSLLFCSFSLCLKRIEEEVFSGVSSTWDT